MKEARALLIRERFIARGQWRAWRPIEVKRAVDRLLIEPRPPCARDNSFGFVSTSNDPCWSRREWLLERDPEKLPTLSVKRSQQENPLMTIAHVFEKARRNSQCLTAISAARFTLKISTNQPMGGGSEC
jgi:hypothetical protein